MPKIEEDHEVFEKLNQGFDYGYINEIIVIPEPASIKGATKRKLFIKGLELDCSGEYVMFFHFDIINNVICADSLTLPEFKFLKDYFMYQ